MEQTILTEIQRRALAEVMADPASHSFVLSGGTALAAFYLRHRRSDDLDFFSLEKVDGVGVESIVQRLKQTLAATDVRFERIADRRLFFFTLPNSELKMEFTYYPFQKLDTGPVIDGVRLDSLRDVMANKLMALLDRFDPKDFVDLYFILQARPLAQIRQDVETKFGLKISNLFLGSELAKVTRVEALPKMIQPLEIRTLKAFFSEQARQLGPGTLE